MDFGSKMEEPFLTYGYIGTARRKIMTDTAIIDKREKDVILKMQFLIFFQGFELDRKVYLSFLTIGQL